MGKGSKTHRSTKARRKLLAQPATARRGRGRPRKDAPRYDNGRLKPEGPNEKVVAVRRALLGDGEASGRNLRAAENPLDLLLARGWIDQEQHSAGKAFARLHAEARMSLPPIRTTNLDIHVRAAPVNGVKPVALWRLNETWREMEGRGAAINALVDVCVLENWPTWLLRAAMALSAEKRAELLQTPGKAALGEGLSAVAQAMRRPAPQDMGEARDLARFVDWLRRV